MESIKGVLIFLGGAAVGSVVTWMCTKSYYKKFYNDLLEKRWASINPNWKEPEKPVDEEPKNDIPEERIRDYTILRKQTCDYKNLANDYSSYYGKGKDIPASEMEHPTEERFRPPYRIEPEEAGYGTDLLTVTYYAADDILVDDLSDESIDPYTTIGEDGVKARLEDDNDAIYIRNEQRGMDYEVLISHGSYSEMMEDLNDISDD